MTLTCWQEGISLAPIIKGGNFERDKPLFWEFRGNRAVRFGKWKLVSEYPENQWYLYNMEDDRTELNDLSMEFPKLAEDLKNKYEDWSCKVGVVPTDSLP